MCRYSSPSGIRTFTPTCMRRLLPTRAAPTLPLLFCLTHVITTSSMLREHLCLSDLRTGRAVCWNAIQVLAINAMKIRNGYLLTGVGAGSLERRRLYALVGRLHLLEILQQDFAPK